MEKASGASEPQPEVLEMEEPARFSPRMLLVFFAIFISISILIAANWGYLSESIKEDREDPAVSPILTKSVGFTQKIKFTVKDDINLPMKVKLRVHFWNMSDNNGNKSLWDIDYSETLDVPQGATIIRTLWNLPPRQGDDFYNGWYVWVDATDHNGKKTTVERIIFHPDTDPDY